MKTLKPITQLLFALPLFLWLAACNEDYAPAHCRKSGGGSHSGKWQGSSNDTQSLSIDVCGHTRANINVMAMA